MIDPAMVKRGLRFEHKRVLDAETMKPAVYVVTRVEHAYPGTVYYKIDGTRKAKDYASMNYFLNNVLGRVLTSA